MALLRTIAVAFLLASGSVVVAADAMTCLKLIADDNDLVDCDLHKLAMDSEIQKVRHEGAVFKIVHAHYYMPQDGVLVDSIPNGTTGNQLKYLFVEEADGGHRYLGQVGGTMLTFHPNGDIVQLWKVSLAEYAQTTYRYDGKLAKVDARVITPVEGE